MEGLGVVMLIQKCFKKYLSEKNYDFVRRLHIYLLDTYHSIFPPEMFLKKMFKEKVGYSLNLNNPTTFNEKLQWLKLHDHNSSYTIMVDKFAVKKYVADKIGEQYTIPTLGVWNTFDEIDFSKLPNRFVLKCTHDCGSVVIVRDKLKMDINAVKRKLEFGLRHNYYYSCFEWPYKNVLPKIIAEKFLENNGDSSENVHDLVDYKFYCFQGVPKFLYISQGLGGDHKLAKMNFLDLNWKRTPFQRPDFAEFSAKELPVCPSKFDIMVEFAKVFSKNIPFLRVDMYFVNDEIYISELTFYPGAGFTPFYPYEWEKTIGSWINL